MQGKIGFCIGADIQRPGDRTVLDALCELGTPPISDGMNRFNTMDPGIKPIVDNIRFSGPAVTLRLRPADNLMLHKSLGCVRPGDVLVVDTCGCTSYSVMGDLIATAAFKAGLAGIVIDGGIRDIRELKQAHFPICARFVTPAVGDKDGPGEINRPISCGGVPVLPGDYIIADDNGVVVVPPEMAVEILEGAKKKLAYEDRRRRQIEEGVIVKPEIDEELKRKGIL